MSLNLVLSSSLSALRVSESGLKVSSQNIANVNTPGYSRVELQTAPRHVIGQGSSGVDVSGLRRAADRFLHAAALASESRLGAAEGRADLLDRAQAAFGDPASDTSTFAAIERTFSAFTLAAGDPGSTILRSRALSETQAMFDEFGRVAGEVEGLRREANERVADATNQLNALLGRVFELNSEITASRLAGGDPTAAENLQDQITTELSTLLDVRVSARALGGVEVRTAQGDQLVGERLSTVRFDRAINGDPTGVVNLVDPAGAVRPIPLTPRSGLLGGLTEVRDVSLPDIASAIETLAAGAATALNATHNQNSVVPAPASLTGPAPSGFDPTQPLGFTGGLTIAVLSNQTGPNGGALQRRVEVDFAAGSLSVNGGAAQTFSSFNDFAAALTAAGAGVTASFANGQVTLAAAGATEGLALGQGVGAGPPSDRAGQGFSQYFGLNDLVRAGADGVRRLVPTTPGALALARADFAVAIGDRALSPNDARGAAALADVRTAARTFPAVGGLPASTQSVTGFAAAVGGLAGERAAQAEQTQTAAEDFRSIAYERRDSAQRVNLDEELVQLEKYQQSYAAAARVMQVATEMLDLLMDIV